MMLPQERYVLSEIFVIVWGVPQKFQAHKVSITKREKLARHPRTIWRIWACDVTPISRMLNFHGQHWLALASWVQPPISAITHIAKFGDQFM